VHWLEDLVEPSSQCEPLVADSRSDLVLDVLAFEDDCASNVGHYVNDLVRKVESELA